MLDAAAPSQIWLLADFAEPHRAWKGNSSAAFELVTTLSAILNIEDEAKSEHKHPTLC